MLHIKLTHTLGEKKVKEVIEVENWWKTDSQTVKEYRC